MGQMVQTAGSFPAGPNERAQRRCLDGPDPGGLASN
jgi:hypothetical protein